MAMPIVSYYHHLQCLLLTSGYVNTRSLTRKALIHVFFILSWCFTDIFTLATVLQNLFLKIHHVHQLILT